MLAFSPVAIRSHNLVGRSLLGLFIPVGHIIILVYPLSTNCVYFLPFNLLSTYTLSSRNFKSLERFWVEAAPLGRPALICRLSVLLICSSPMTFTRTDYMFKFIVIPTPDSFIHRVSKYFHIKQFGHVYLTLLLILQSYFTMFTRSLHICLLFKGSRRHRPVFFNGNDEVFFEFLDLVVTNIWTAEHSIIFSGADG